MTLTQYLDTLNQRYKLGNATEHTFRGDLQQLIESLVPGIRATNEPKRQSCGAPDYILTKKDIPVGFIEAKDIGDRDLEGAKKTGNKEQFDRYKASLDNLIFTDYLTFVLYRDGEFVTKISIGEASPNPSKGGEKDAISETDGAVNEVLGENVLPPSFVGAGGGQTSENTEKLQSVGGNDGGQTLPYSDEQVKQRPGYVTANLYNYPYIKEIRDGLKGNQTDAEKIIWEYLRNKKTGHKIRRQHVIEFKKKEKQDFFAH